MAGGSAMIDAYFPRTGDGATPQSCTTLLSISSCSTSVVGGKFMLSDFWERVIVPMTWHLVWLWLRTNDCSFPESFLGISHLTCFRNFNLSLWHVESRLRTSFAKEGHIHGIAVAILNSLKLEWVSHLTSLQPSEWREWRTKLTTA